MASWMDRATRVAEVLRRGRVLVVSPSEEQAGAIARGLADLDLIPILAFDEEGARRTADSISCNVAVIDVRVVSESPLPLIRDVSAQVGAGTLVLGPCEEPADRLFDAGAFLLGLHEWPALHVAARVSTRLRIRPPLESRSTLACGPARARPRDAPCFVGRHAPCHHADRVQGARRASFSRRARSSRSLTFNLNFGVRGRRSTTSGSRLTCAGCATSWGS